MCLATMAAAACSTAAPAREQTSQAAYLKSWSEIYHSEEQPASEETYRRSLELLKAPSFGTLSPSMQHLLTLRTAEVGLQRKDYAGAHQLAVRASSMSDAGVADWLVRLDAAYFGDDRLDASRSLTYFFRQWPDNRSRIPYAMVVSLAGRAPRSKAEKEARFQLLEALYQAHWADEDGVAPGDLWGELVQELAERGDLQRALEIVGQINSPRVMVTLRADKRFDSLVRQAPMRFDIAAAGEREVGDWAGAVQRFPRRLDAIVQLTYALLDVGQYDEVYKITQEILAAVDEDNFHRSFDDDETALNWILDNHARALEALQHFKDAEWDLRSSADRLEHGQRNVSNIINLAAFEERTGRGDEALKVLAELPADDAQMAPYGRMQWYDARLVAALMKGDEALASASLAYMAAHQADALSTYQLALLRMNRLDDAAKLLIRRLADPATREAALSEVQRYHDPPGTPVEQILSDRLRQLLQRADVQAAIDRVGRVLDVPLPSPIG